MANPTPTPSRKITLGALAGALATVLVCMLQVALPDTRFPAGLESAFATLIFAGVGYFVRERT